MLAVVAAVAAGCTSPPSSPSSPSSRRPDATAASPVRDAALDASVAQFRFDEGTRNLKAGVTNNSHGDIVVTRATIRWEGFAFPIVGLSAEPVHPGQTAAFDIEYGPARCDRPPTRPPVLVATVDGRARSLPLRVDDPGLLERLRIKACAEQRLAQNSGVSLRPAPSTVVVRGEEYLPATLMLRRRTGAESVRIVDLGGSVLLELVPRGGRGALPATLGPGDAALRFPVLLGSAHRCDPHALGQSSQTFLISAYLQVGRAPVQREILHLSVRDRDRLLALIGRDCR
jgi:hypothetical protein